MSRGNALTDTKAPVVATSQSKPSNSETIIPPCRPQLSHQPAFARTRPLTRHLALYGRSFALVNQGDWTFVASDQTMRDLWVTSLKTTILKSTERKSVSKQYVLVWVETDQASVSPYTRVTSTTAPPRTCPMTLIVVSHAVSTTVGCQRVQDDVVYGVTSGIYSTANIATES